MKMNLDMIISNELKTKVEFVIIDQYLTELWP
jgi:hypothetical protein